MQYKVISFFSEPDPKVNHYRNHAHRLHEELSKLKLNHEITELPSKGNYYLNTRMKPRFILDALKQAQCSVLWLDVDSFGVVPLEKDYGQANIVALQKKDPPYTHFIYSHALLFSYNEDTIAFLEDWANACESRDPKEKMSDHGILIETLKKWQGKISLRYFDEPVCKLGLTPRSIVKSK